MGIACMQDHQGALQSAACDPGVAAQAPRPACLPVLQGMSGLPAMPHHSLQDLQLGLAWPLLFMGMTGPHVMVTEQVTQQMLLLWALQQSWLQLAVSDGKDL